MLMYAFPITDHNLEVSLLLEKASQPNALSYVPAVAPHGSVSAVRNGGVSELKLSSSLSSIEHFVPKCLTQRKMHMLLRKIRAHRTLYRQASSVSSTDKVHLCSQRDNTSSLADAKSGRLMARVCHGHTVLSRRSCQECLDLGSSQSSFREQYRLERCSTIMVHCSRRVSSLL